MKYLYYLSIVGFYFATVSGFLYIPGLSDKIQPEDYDDGEPGNALILTPFIKQGKLEEARKAAEVNFPDFKDVKSYSGYFTVNSLYNSNLFFWFFPAKNDYENAPVVLWLQGGPGASSLGGLFTENGPFELSDNGTLQLREYLWSQNHSVIYIDNPVGAGFSFTREGGYARNQTIIANELYDGLLQFFAVFAEIQKNPFFITGESYGGKYVPSLAYAIHKFNAYAEAKINLQGLAIGNGMTDPKHQMVYADYLYQIGLIDSNARTEVKKLQKEVVGLIHHHGWVKAAKFFNLMFGFVQYESGFSSPYNYLDPSDILDKVTNSVTNYVTRPDVRAAIHVDNATFYALNQYVYNKLNDEFMQSVAPWVSELLSHYRVLFYNGQLDMIVAYPTTVNFLRHLDFKGADEYKTAERHMWYVDSELAGYVKQAGNLTEVMVRNAGHMVPSDQPRWALDLLTKFTRNISLHK